MLITRRRNPKFVDQRVFVMLWRAASLLCVIERRRGVVLGMGRTRRSDACCISWIGLLCIAGKMFFVLTTCVVVQLGDGRRTGSTVPVGVFGLSSGVVMIASGLVRFVLIALQPLSVRGWSLYF